jgi:hypothetical protein
MRTGGFMSSADLGQSILFFILFFWAFLAVAAILTTLVKKGKISGINVLEKWRTRHDHHDASA